MSSYVEVRGVKIGEGVPKICVPIVGKTKEEILAAAKSFADVKMDVVEWRVDWFDGVFDFAQVEDVLKDLRPALGNTPILFTFRTSKEGGEKAIEPDVYVELNKKAAATGLVDLVDVEAFTAAWCHPLFPLFEFFLFFGNIIFKQILTQSVSSVIILFPLFKKYSFSGNKHLKSEIRGA